MSEGTLFVVATPIGNLDDLSPRAREVLGRADLIAAEDTRVTGRLLSHVGIKVRSLALHDHNEEKVVPELIEALESGNSVALVSDAGTPLVSDPGYRLVRAAHNVGEPHAWRMRAACPTACSLRRSEGDRERGNVKRDGPRPN